MQTMAILKLIDIKMPKNIPLIAIRQMIKRQLPNRAAESNVYLKY